MKRKKAQSESLKQQVKRQANKPAPKEDEAEGDVNLMTSTGSTLLDLAISGGRIRGGGLPAGILVEIFGPSGSGKTVMLSEIAGNIQNDGGEALFYDPEARLNKQFAKMFRLKIDDSNYEIPERVPDIFTKVRKWEPENSDIVNGVFADSLAALSTQLEMSDEGDKMGMRRAKEFSEELRKTCRIIKKRNLLIVCSNQIRETLNQFGPKYKSPGGEAIGFYSSVRLKLDNPKRITRKRTIHKKEQKRVVGVETEVEVFKNSTWKPFRTAPLLIYFDYGIDDIRANLQFIKDHTKNTTYTIGGRELSNDKNKAIAIIEEEELEDQLREEVIDLWGKIEEKFKSDRKPKKK